MKIICNTSCNTREPALEGRGWTLLTSVLLLLMPKCAFCWAAYMSLFSSLGLVTIPYQGWFLPISVLLFLLTLGKLLYHAIYSKNFIAFILALLAGLIILFQKTGNEISGLNYVAISLMIIAVMKDNLLMICKRIFSFRLQEQADTTN